MLCVVLLASCTGTIVVHVLDSHKLVLYSQQREFLLMHAVAFGVLLLGLLPTRPNDTSKSANRILLYGYDGLAHVVAAGGSNRSAILHQPFDLANSQ